MQRRTLLKSLGASAALLTARSHALALPSAAAPPTASYNQLGFLPNGAKAITLRADPARRDNRFRIVAVHGSQPSFEGEMDTPAFEPNSGEQMQLARFSGLRTPGMYRLEATGLRTEPFAINATVYREALRLAMRAFYGQRCGCAIDLGGGYRHPACHLIGGFHPSSGRSGPVPSHGGWHDAGDYGRYAVNSGISTGTLLWTWEMYESAVRNLSLGIPESGGPLPDFLAEVSWNLNWMLSLQDADGGVWQKQTSEHFCAFIMPQDDHLTSYIIGTGAAPYKSTCATADLAAVAAIAARCYRPFDAPYADRCLQAAQRAWRWAEAHPDVTFVNPPGVGTGQYGDGHCADELLWASAELWRTTGRREYEEAFLRGFHALPPGSSIEAPAWSSVGPMAYWTYALAGRAGDRAVVEWVRDQTGQAAARLIAQAAANGYGETLAPADYGWGSNGTAANQSMLLLIADRFHPNQKAVDAALGNLDYLLGRNCFGVSWVTQLGTRPFQHPHHRPSAADGIAAPWPGLLSGGPNGHPADAVASTLPRRPPMQMWIDDQRAYSVNEVAINWNAPLVFLLAAANGR